MEHSYVCIIIIIFIIFQCVLRPNDQDEQILALCTVNQDGFLEAKFMVWWNPFPKLLASLNLYEETIKMANKKNDMRKGNSTRKTTDWHGSGGLQVAFG